MSEALKTQQVYHLEDLAPLLELSENNVQKYSVKNFKELFKLGKSFYEDYKSGVKSFAFTSTGYYLSQQKTILGLATYFDYNTDLKILIASENLDKGAFKKIKEESEELRIFVGDKNEISLYNFNNHFFLTDIAEIVAIGKESRNLESVKRTVRDLKEYLDVILWDVPEMSHFKEGVDSYLPLVMSFDSISLIINKKFSERKDAEEIQKFFEDYGISFKGLIFQSANERGSE